MTLKEILLIISISILSIIVLLFIIYGFIMAIVFKKTFGRSKCISLLDLDLRNTHYNKHLKQIKEYILYFSSIPYEVVKIKNDNLVLSGKYYNNGSPNTVIMAHGYHAKSLNNFHASGISFLNHGYNILMIDERAHNDSEGKFTTMGLKEQYDILEWIKWVERTTNTQNIVLYGVSMGAASVCYLSNKLENTLVRAIVSDCGFTSFYDEIFYQERKRIDLLLILFFMRLYAKMFLHIDIKNRVSESLKDDIIPIYFIHGLDDEMVPVEHTITNFNAVKAEKKVRYVAGAGHTTSFLIDYDYLDKDVFSFINKYIDD